MRCCIQDQSILIHPIDSSVHYIVFPYFCAKNKIKKNILYAGISTHENSSLQESNGIDEKNVKYIMD